MESIVIKQGHRVLQRLIFAELGHRARGDLHLSRRPKMNNPSAPNPPLGCEARWTSATPSINIGED
jgi:hypothetical protein